MVAVAEYRATVVVKVNMVDGLDLWAPDPWIGPQLQTVNSEMELEGRIPIPNTVPPDQWNWYAAKELEQMFRERPKKLVMIIMPVKTVL